MGYFRMVAGDLEPAMQVPVVVNGAAVDLSTATSVQLRWQAPDGIVTLLPLTVIDAVNGITKHTWSAGETDKVGTHRGQVVVTWPGTPARPQTLPNDYNYVYWFIRPALA